MASSVAKSGMSRRPRQEILQRARRLLRNEGLVEAEPQALRQRVVERRRRDEDLGIPGIEHLRLKQLVERSHGILVEHLGMVMRADNLQELSEELEIDQAATDILKVPDVVRPLLLHDLVAHDADVGCDLRPVPLPAQHL